METVKSILLIISALFPIVNPLGNSPVFLAMASDYPRDVRFVLARKVAVNSFLLMAASFLIGTHILRFFGISIPVVQVGGGFVVIANGWALLRRKDEPSRSQPSEVDPKDIFRSAFYPLTMPLTVGPGAISVAITLGANEERGVANLLLILAAMVGVAIVAVSVFLCYGFAYRLAAVVGDSGMSIILRLSSFLLVCIGVQIIWNGLSALIGTLR